MTHDDTPASEPTPSEDRIGQMIRSLHYHGCPPDVRLEDDVDTDVEDILSVVRAESDARVAEAVREWEARFDLYHAADERGVQEWRAAHPDEDELMSPDKGRLVAWLLANRDEERAEAFRKGYSAGSRGDE